MLLKKTGDRKIREEREQDNILIDGRFNYDKIDRLLTEKKEREQDNLLIDGIFNYDKIYRLLIEKKEREQDNLLIDGRFNYDKIDRLLIERREREQDNILIGGKFNYDKIDRLLIKKQVIGGRMSHVDRRDLMSIIKKNGKNLNNDELNLFKTLSIHNELSKEIYVTSEDLQKIKSIEESKLKTDLLKIAKPIQGTNLSKIDIAVTLDINNSVDAEGEVKKIGMLDRASVFEKLVKSLNKLPGIAKNTLKTIPGIAKTIAKTVKDNSYAAIPFLTAVSVQAIRNAGVDIDEDTAETFIKYGSYGIMALWNTMEDYKLNKNDKSRLSSILRGAKSTGTEFMGLLVENNVSSIISKRYGSVVGIVSGTIVKNIFKGTILLVSGEKKKDDNEDDDEDEKLKDINNDIDKNIDKNIDGKLNSPLRNFTMGVGAAICSQLYMYALYGGNKRTIKGTINRTKKMIKTLGSLTNISKHSNTIMVGMVTTMLEYGIQQNNIDKMLQGVKNNYNKYMSRYLKKVGININAENIDNFVKSGAGAGVGSVIGAKIGGVSGSAIGGVIGAGFYKGLPIIEKFILDKCFRKGCDTLLSNLVFKSIDKGTDIGMKVFRNKITQNAGKLSGNAMKNGFDFATSLYSNDKIPSNLSKRRTFLESMTESRKEDKDKEETIEVEEAKRMKERKRQNIIEKRRKMDDLRNEKLDFQQKYKNALKEETIAVEEAKRMKERKQKRQNITEERRKRDDLRNEKLDFQQKYNDALKEEIKNIDVNMEKVTNRLKEWD